MTNTQSYGGHIVSFQKQETEFPHLNAYKPSKTSERRKIFARLKPIFDLMAVFGSIILLIIQAVTPTPYNMVFNIVVLILGAILVLTASIRNTLYFRQMSPQELQQSKAYMGAFVWLVISSYGFFSISLVLDESILLATATVLFIMINLSSLYLFGWRSQQQYIQWYFEENKTVLREMIGWKEDENVNDQKLLSILLGVSAQTEYARGILLGIVAFTPIIIVLSVLLLRQ